MTKRTAEMLRVDLEAAGIPYETDSGFADFHSLRGDFISYLVSSGASVKTCQTLARHSSPTMTIGIYAKASLHDINGAVENLPDLTAPVPRPEALRMTGTDATATRSATRSLEVVTDELTQVECLQRIGPRGGTADASVLGADVRKDVGVRFSPRPVVRFRVDGSCGWDGCRSGFWTWAKYASVSAGHARWYSRLSLRERISPKRASFRGAKADNLLARQNLAGNPPGFHLTPGARPVR
jgi:hypothetical protein